MKTSTTPPQPPAPAVRRQLRLPLFYEGSTALGEEVQVLRQGESVWYFLHGTPVYSHTVKDVASFRAFTSSLCQNGVCKLVDVERTFSVSAISVKRALKQFRKDGAASFYVSRRPKRLPRVWSAQRLDQAQELLDKGHSNRDVGARLGIKRDTVYRAVKGGRLRGQAPKTEVAGAEDGAAQPTAMPVESAGMRSAADHAAAAELGTACHDIVGRTGAMLGLSGPAQPQFKPAIDVPGAGVLTALPALLANGLFHQVDQHFVPPPGYYPMAQLFLLFAFLVLARVRSLEQVRNQMPGEWGRILGLDRIPEVKTLRAKLKHLAQPAPVGTWGQAMGRFWMEADPDLAGILYVDGHVRAYHGSQTRLPERFSSRDRLCVRSFMDYWVNDRDGAPFFVVTAVGTEGMLHHLRREIVPRLLREVPGQPSPADLSADPRRHRFAIVFDREGWSPDFFAELWREHRIGVITYRKGRYDPWPSDAFAEHQIDLPHGNRVSMNIGESSWDHKASEAPGVAFREIRRLSVDRQHQTAIITTIQTHPMVSIASHMFSRWSQENFLNYASRELAIDRLAGYALDPAPGEAEVRNPAWRLLDQRARQLRAERASLLAERGRLQPLDQQDAAMEAYLEKAGANAEKIAHCQEALDAANAGLRETPRRVPISTLPEGQRPSLIAQACQQFLAVLKITAYRAETALVGILRQHLGRWDDARALVRDLFRHDADLIPDPVKKTLTVKVHHFTNPQASRAVDALLKELTAAEALYPGTHLVLKYELVSEPIPRGQDP